MGIHSQKTKLSREDFMIVLFLMLTMFIVTAIYSQASFLYKYIYDIDPACFRAVANGWLHGKMPYRDMFDHKGIVMYSIYAVGLLIGKGTNNGIFLLSFAANSISVVGMYFICRLRENKQVSFVTTFVLLAIMFATDSGQWAMFCSGMQCESFCLPAIVCSLYIFERAFAIKDGKLIEIPRWHLYFAGVMGGLVFMIKFNHCLFFAAIYGAYFLWMLVRKGFKRFILAGLSFVAGILTIVTPCIIYMAFNRILDDFFECYIKFNTVYVTTHSDTIIDQMYISLSEKILVPVTLAFSLVVVLLGRRGKIYRLGYTLAVIVYSIMLMTINCYAYYLLVLVPFMLPGVSFLISWIDGKLEKSLVKRLLAVAISIIFFCEMFALCPNKLNAMAREDDQRQMLASRMIEVVPSDISIIQYGATCSSYYELCDAIPQQKLFYMPPKGNDEMRSEQLAYLVNHEVDFVIIRKGRNAIMTNNEALTFFEELGYHYFGEDAGYIVFICSDRCPQQ